MKTYFIKIRATSDYKRELEELAAYKGLTVSSYIRYLVAADKAANPGAVKGSEDYEQLKIDENNY